MPELKQIIVVFLITLAVVAGFLLLLNYSRRRLRRTPHGLTGICHRDGGRLCSSCAGNLEDKQQHDNYPP